jgi:predicted secreted protein
LSLEERARNGQSAFSPKKNIKSLKLNDVYGEKGYTTNRQKRSVKITTLDVLNGIWRLTT